MNAPMFVVPRREILAEMTAATLFAPQRGFGHQFRQSHEILRSIVDVLASHRGEFFDSASQILTAADKPCFAPHNLLNAFFDLRVQPPLSEIESNRGRRRLSRPGQ